LINTPEVQGGILFTTKKPTQEMITTILSYCGPQKDTYFNLKTEPIDKQRFTFFKGSVYSWTEETRAESDTHIYWAVNVCDPKWNKKGGLYLKRNSVAGATYDKATKKFKWWFGKQAIIQMPNIVKDMCDYFKSEWFDNVPQGLKISTTNSTLSKVLSGKITNPRDLIRGIIKANPTMQGMNISIETMWKYCNARPGMRLQSLSDVLSVAKDPNHAIEYMVDKDYMSHDMLDLIKQGQMLNRKIDFKWSKSRISEVHTEWTKEIMDIEQESVESIDYQYVNELPSYGCLELITNSKDLYIEGRLMSHCVYTNYATNVLDKNYFVFKFTNRDVRGTIGVQKHWNKNEFVVNQFYGKFNKTIDRCHHDYVEEWVARPDVQQWFKDNYKSNELSQPAEMINLDF
jgi:hypothetical protein